MDPVTSAKTYWILLNNKKIATGLEPRTTQFLNEQMVECSFKN